MSHDRRILFLVPSFKEFVLPYLPFTWQKYYESHTVTTVSIYDKTYNDPNLIYLEFKDIHDLDADLSAFYDLLTMAFVHDIRSE
jgi:hypothetical protein